MIFCKLFSYSKLQKHGLSHRIGQLSESAIIEAPMPSRIGHMLAGVATAWTVDLVSGHRILRTESSGWRALAGGGLTAACAVLGAAPDIDLLAGGVHRS